MSTNFENSEEKRINCEGGFGIMPHRLRKSENISSSAKLLFCALIELQHEKGYCYASNRYLAIEEFNGVSTRSIQLWLSELEREGWIKIIITRNKENEVVERRIYTNLNQNIPHENFMTPREKFFTTPPEKNFTIKRKSNEKEIKENTKRNTDLMKNIPASGSPSSPDVDELSENVSSIKPKKVKKLKDYEKDELFLSTWKTLPEYMRGCGPVKAYKIWVKATEKSTKNVEEIKKAITFYLKTLPEWQHPQHFSTFLNQGTWEEFYARAVEQDQKQERARALREKQQKEEAEQRKRVLKERAQVFEAKYQALKNKLNAGYDTLEEISQENEELFYDVVQQIRDYERKLEEKEAEIKHQKEIEQKKIDAENSKHNLDECERELWTYISQVIDANAYLDRNKKRLPNSYETFKNLFSNGETLLEVVFGDKSKEPVVDSLKNNILVFLMHEMSNEEVRNLYNKRNEAWTKFNRLQKEII